MNDAEIKSKIEQELNSLPQNFAANFIIDQRIYNRTNLMLLLQLIKKQHNGLYISLNKPYETLHRKLKRNNIDPNVVYCIDAVSRKTGSFSDSEKCFCLEGPSSLAELSLLTASLLDDKKIRFIFLDSLGTLLLYNEAKEAEKFLHSLINKARKSDVSVVVTSPKEESKEDMFAEVTQFCDKEIVL